MANQYYRKDIHKSIDKLLYGLYVYQYLLDTSTLGLLLRCLLQDQILSLKTKTPTLRVALYIVFATAFLAILRHLDPPGRYGVIIDFIGNVSLPSRSKLLWLDSIITMLQIVQALILFEIRKIEGGSRRYGTANRQQARRREQSSNSNSDAQSNRQQHETGIRSSQSSNATQQRSSSSRTRIGITSSSRNVSSVQANSVASQSSPSLLFEHTSERDANDRELNSDYYVDDEETRHSLEHSRESTGDILNSTTSEADHRSGSDSNEEEEDEGLLGNDYEEVLEQETFILQLEFHDVISYLFSGQEAISMPRISSARAIADGVESTRVQNLPV
ncbi:hypothetical protein BX616_008762 [Lobosporangium transversale]|uniref:DUF1746 domain-containing protein n=1 Tax=Lobosporangium transversale TaxID=64571 RepID=A0A1Y2GZ43_9FUNG|nr:hypothetical protein BCR41DRAFT_347250 [Lobosporangium transversale]KAF9914205.1 hypothetical protein BX616_008762 [Lobosporangium transversale]ORZ27021.1 hypothetical protein BCR41DRAFT_347250 [Lobosporangium transversale]|eukprot:XP_021884768.1 hypothetical protein BCR41DRAFT_347250 [Lobosporangium transversale]